MSGEAAPALRVICASLSLVQGSVMAQLLAARAKFCAFGSECGVRSAWLYASGWFFQWHEGPPQGMDKMLEAVSADKRHHRMRVLHRSTGAPSLAGPLQIATIQNHEKPTDVARRLFVLEQDQANQTAAQPRELWRQLVAPPGPHGCVVARRQLVAVASADSGALDLVRSIGLRLGLPVSYQRFATGAAGSADFGAVYVDVQGPSHVMRFQALSRRSLAHPTVGLLLEDARCVLLMGEAHGPARALADELAGLFARLALRPLVRLSGSGAVAAGPSFECLEPGGGHIARIEPAVLWRQDAGALYQVLLAPRCAENLETALSD